MNYLRRLIAVLVAIPGFILAAAQGTISPKFTNSTIYTGIEVGSKGVKMSVIEIGKNAQTNGAFNILKDTSVNTDFISFSDSTFTATLEGLAGFYNKSLNDYKIPSKRIFTVVSSGVKMQAEKDSKQEWINRLISSFRTKINEPNRTVEVVDVALESKLSHLGIVPESRRYSTFLIDIGSGNTKGGFFPYANTDEFRLFQINWGTKSTTNAAEKNSGEDKTLVNYYRQLNRVLAGAENSEIIMAVNSSGAYPVSDNIAVSGGIAWAVSSILHPELIDNSVVTVTYAEVVKLQERLYYNIGSLVPAYITMSLHGEEKELAQRELKRVFQVFDQRALMAGTGLLLKIMRQFESTFESKQFFLIKNGQVGWVSAYVDKQVSN